MNAPVHWLVDAAQRRYPKVRHIVGLLLSLASFVSFTVAADPVDCGNKPISIAFFDFGFLYFEQDGQGRGIDKDLVDELAKRTGCKFSTQTMPRARVWADLASGELDMSLSGVQSPDRDRFAWFAPYSYFKNFAVIRTSTATTVSSAEDFMAQGSLQFGVVRGFVHQPAQEKWLEQLRSSQRVQESASISMLFEKLKLGRIDGLFALPVVYRKILQEMKMQDEVVIRDWTPKDKASLGCLVMAKSRFSQAEAVRWRNVVLAIRTDGTLERIYARYLSPAEARAGVDF